MKRLYTPARASDNAEARALASIGQIEVSRVADIFSHLHKQAGYPAEVRGFSLALLGASEGRDDAFEMPYVQLAARLRSVKGESPDALRKWLQRQWREYDEAQKAARVIFATIFPGGVVQGEKRPTRMRCYLPSYIRQIQNLILGDAHYSLGPEVSIMRAVARVIEAEEKTNGGQKRPTMVDRFNRPAPDFYSQLKRICTQMKRAHHRASDGAEYSPDAVLQIFETQIARIRAGAEVDV